MTMRSAFNRVLSAARKTLQAIPKFFRAWRAARALRASRLKHLEEFRGTSSGPRPPLDTLYGGGVLYLYRSTNIAVTNVTWS